MMAEGTDGTSRGHFKEGVSIGENMLTFLPWNESAFERTELLEPWLLSWMPTKTEILTPEGWFTRGHDQLGGAFDRHGFWQHQIVPGSFIWAPPPAAADVVVEQLSITRHKRSASFHLVVVPRLMTGCWRKHLARATDFEFQLVNDQLWSLESQFEPLLVFVGLPLVAHRPEFEQSEKLLGGLERLLQGPRMQEEAHQSWFRDSLRELWASSWELCPV